MHVCTIVSKRTSTLHNSCNKPIWFQSCLHIACIGTFEVKYGYFKGVTQLNMEALKAYI